MAKSVEANTGGRRLLVTLCRMAQGHRLPCTIEELAVDAWQCYPKMFGMRGFYKKYPDLHRVRGHVDGPRGIVRRGWVARVQDGRYVLTSQGAKLAMELLPPGATIPSVRMVYLPQGKEMVLTRLLDSEALRKMEEGRKQELTSGDAWQFWAITPALRGESLDRHLRQIECFLLELAQDLEPAGGELTSVQLGNDRVVEMRDLRVVTHLHQYLLARFESHIKLLLGRRL